MDYKKLEELNNLRQAGALTEEEFEREKQKLFTEDSSLEKPTPLPLGIDETAYLALINFALLIPTVGWIASIVLWIIGKPNSEKLNTQGKYILNWLITWLILGIFIFIGVILAIALSWATLGISMIIGLLLFALLGITYAILTFVFPIVGGIKGLNGETWKYPVSIPFLK